MTKRIIFALLCLAVLPLQAQRIHGYVTAGTSVSQVEGDELKGFGHWGLAGSVGAYVDLDEHDTWGLTIEPGYACRGIYNNKHSSDNYYNIKLDLHYVDIPLTVFYRDPVGGLRVGLGLVYSRLVAQPHGTMALRPHYFLPDTSNMAFLKNDLAPALEVRFNVWRNLQFSARYQYSIIPVKRDWHFKLGDNHEWDNNCYNSSLTFRLIWQFK